jgi:hypothetical protein
VITDEDALRFLRARGVSPEWDDEINEDDGTGEDEGAGMTERAHERERVPPPPLGRVAFNRLLLEAAEAAGLNVGAGAKMPHEHGWDGSARDAEVEAKVLAFQERVHRVVRRPTFRGLPTARCRPTQGADFRILMRALSWDEYAAQLEEDYYAPWRVAWTYGRSGRGEERTLRHVKGHVLRVFEGLGYADRVPVAAAIHAGTVVSRCLTVGEAFFYVEDAFPTADRGPSGRPRVRLVERRAWGVLPEDWAWPVACAAGLAATAAAVWGALPGHYYSGWWLLALVPALPALTLALESGLSSAQVLRWVAPERTFGDLAREIAERNRREWERLQEEYGAAGAYGAKGGG